MATERIVSALCHVLNLVTAQTYQLQRLQVCKPTLLYSCEPTLYCIVNIYSQQKYVCPRSVTDVKFTFVVAM